MTWQTRKKDLIEILEIKNLIPEIKKLTGADTDTELVNQMTDLTYRDKDMSKRQTS